MTIFEIAQLVAANLNEGDFAEEFTAAAMILPSYQLKEMETLQVSVVPKSQEFGRLSRDTTGREVKVDIGIQKRLSADADGKLFPDEIQPLFALVDAIALYVDGQRIGESIICSSVANEPVYAPEHIEQYRQFTSILTLTLKVV